MALITPLECPSSSRTWPSFWQACSNGLERDLEDEEDTRVAKWESGHICIANECSPGHSLLSRRGPMSVHWFPHMLCRCFGRIPKWSHITAPALYVRNIYIKKAQCEPELNQQIFVIKNYFRNLHLLVKLRDGLDSRYKVHFFRKWKFDSSAICQ